jgi:hypothetical protein
MMRFDRREFLRVAGGLAGLAAVPWLAACPPEGGPNGANPDAGAANPAALPSSGGAPDTHEGWTIAALCDTVVPGKWRDPAGTPGALDSGAPAMFFDPELPALAYVPLLVLALDVFARDVVAGSQFVDLAPADRDEALARAIAQLDLLDFAIQLVKLAHYSTQVAGDALGYPGANPGYVGDSDFSFGRAMSREITVDGNVP